ncbi:hypothetical protein CC86DRAFT_366937 [Ophiobolus disseminans]|uniref:Heterokaryon incompatibility domain-containing protein n=1 Tax=Ophiobolus disseminans TaxID=1469910 RepID=A0A6A7AG19_9PLEO|nr:hypothetical protein CC86DRAFT_366937 [Ophiobolus disseminans]
MGEVYSKASSVIAWLGEDEGTMGGEVAVAVMTVHATMENGLKANPGRSLDDLLANDIEGAAKIVPVDEENSSGMNTVSLYAVEGPPPNSFPSMQDVVNLFYETGRPNPFRALNTYFGKQYWQRVWCVQELRLAPKAAIRIGSLQIPAECVATFAAWYQAKVLTNQISHPIHSTGINNAGPMLLNSRRGRFRQQHHHPTQLLPTLHDFRNFQATNPRDKVYGLMGVAQRELSHVPLYVDYRKSVNEVYQDAVRSIIGDTNDLQALSYVDHGAEYYHNSGYSSWVPRRDSPTCVCPTLWYERNEYSAGPPLSNIRTLFACPGLLNVTGIYFDTVTFSSHEIDAQAALFVEDKALKDIFDKFAGEIEQDRSRDSSNAPGQYRLSAEALATAFTGGFTFMHSPTTYMTYVDKLHGEYGYWFMQDFWRRVRRESSSDASSPSWNTNAYDEKARDMCNHRRIFRTSRGYVGLGPACMREEDHVVVLEGAKVPVVLRPLNLDMQEFAFTGECFVYDIWCGQIMRMVGKDNVKEMHFILR